MKVHKLKIRSLTHLSFAALGLLSIAHGNASGDVTVVAPSNLSELHTLTDSSHYKADAAFSAWREKYREEEKTTGYHTVPAEEFTDLAALDFAQATRFLTDFKRAKEKTTLPDAVDLASDKMIALGYEAIGVLSEKGFSALSALYVHPDFGVVNVVQQDLSNHITMTDNEAYNAQLFQTPAILVVERKQDTEAYYSTVIWTPSGTSLEYSFSANINLADEANAATYLTEIESILAKVPR